MNLHGLRIFHAIASLGSVSGAAEQLRISQPAVTMQLRKLESELGLRLTRSNGRGIALTEAGTWLSTQAARLFALEEEIEQQCVHYQHGMKGNLRIATTYLPANYILPPLLALYRQDRPDVNVSLSSSNAQTALDKLLRYEADIAFIGGHNYHFPEEVETIVCQEDELWFVALPDHPLANHKVQYHELVQFPFIMRDSGSYTRDAWISLCTAAGVPVPLSSLQVSGPQEAVRAALAGLGITLASAMEVKESIAAGALIRLDVQGPQAINTISCCVRAGDPQPPQVRAFMELIHLSIT
jgi:DNA-binding transcriptional LysR family regulator